MSSPSHEWIPSKWLTYWRSHLKWVLHTQEQAVFNRYPLQGKSQWSYQNGTPLDLNNESIAEKTWESWEIHFLFHFSPHSGILKEILGRSLDGCSPMEDMHWIFLVFKWCFFSKSFPRLAMVVERGDIRENILKSFHPFWRVLVWLACDTGCCGSLLPSELQLQCV